jgi:hypothetical protein
MAYQSHAENPGASSFRSRARTVIEVRNRPVELVTTVRIESDPDSFHVLFTRQIHENDALVRERTWEETIPRRFQ